MGTEGRTSMTNLIFVFVIFRKRLKIRQCVQKSLRVHRQGMIPYSYLATWQDLKVGNRRLCKGTYEGNISDLSCQSHTTYIDIILSLFYVSEDVDTAICGKQEEGCVNLARSEWSTVNVQIIQQGFQSHWVALIAILLSVMGKFFVLWRQYITIKINIKPARQLSHNFTLNIRLYDTDLYRIKYLNITNLYLY